MPQLDTEDGATALDEFDHLKEAEHLRRLTEDQDLLTTLQLHRLQGPTWERFADVLARYGYQVIRAWVWTRQIFPRCAQRGFGLPQPAQLRWTKEQADEVALETVAMAIRSFRDYVLREGRWSPTRGATLRTYFVGQCLLQSPTSTADGSPSWSSTIRRSRSSRSSMIPWTAASSAIRLGVW